MSSTSDRSRNGRYVSGGSATVEAGKLSWWERKVLPTADDDVPFPINRKYHLRPDLVAFDAYGRSDLMWVVLQFNNIVDINEEFQAGTTISLPTRRRLFTELLTTIK